ncbi:MAG: YraN family protein [Candidatus Delongbacteria bacterium]|nr:YraN family protein [Candidatus Delongbacteria bacterium]
MSLYRKTMGRQGEDLAVQWLETHGFCILERNFRTRYGEIDIIAEKDMTMHFIEVKYRHNLQFGAPETAISARKQTTLRKVAWSYLKIHGLTRPSYVFDLIAILKNDRGAPSLSHIVNAF